MMKVTAIKTSLFKPKKEALESFIVRHVKNHVKEKSILAVTSKIVSLSEERTQNKKHISKEQLVRRESEHYLGPTPYGVHLSIHQGILLPSAGIDESNAPDENYILYPKNPFESAAALLKKLKKKLGVKNLGIILTDSITLPLRRGVVGIALSYSGFTPVRCKIGDNDLYGRPLKMTNVNLVDPLAGACVLLMGEGSERKPLAVIENPPVKFSNKKSEKKSISIPVEEDLFYPIYKKTIL